MEENKRYEVIVTDTMKFLVVDSINNYMVKMFDSLELAKEYCNQLNSK